MAKEDRYVIIIRKNATHDAVTVFFGDEFVQVDLNKLSYHDKQDYLIRLVNWGVNGYKGNPPTLHNRY